MGKATAHRLRAVLIASVATLFVLAPLSEAATPATADGDSSAFARYPAGPASIRVASTYFGTTEIQSVVNVLAGLRHGPELSQLSVYIASPEEIVQTCGATVVACYLPAQKRMIVSGIDRRIAGVPRDFAIAHEYGHHVANSQTGDGSALVRGTLRWATHQKVCQYTRARKLFPGDQGAHYFDNPEEAFAQSFALLSIPHANVSWQYSPLLRPTRASQAKLRADLARPWTGPSALGWSGEVEGAPPAEAVSRPVTVGSGSRRIGIDASREVGPRPWVAKRRLRAPLDGKIDVSLSAPQGVAYRVVLRDAITRRALAHAATDEAGSGNFSFPNCGHHALRLEVRSLHGGGPFTATIVRP